MKKTLLFISTLCICFSVFSQNTEKENTEITNEIKINLLMTVLSFPDISYERIWKNTVGFGVSLGFPIESQETNFRILPYGRFYFGESTVKSFFIEGNMAIEGYKGYTYDYSTYSSSTKNSARMGLGVAFGYKYINRSGFIGELFFGLGRSFGDNTGIYPRCGISIGKQF